MNPRPFLAVFLLSALMAFPALADVDTEIDPNKRFDQVTFLAAHNAFAATEDGWLYAQQTLSVPNQLRYGVRALMLDIWESREGLIEKECRQVEKPVEVVEEVCKTVTEQACSEVTKTKDVCREVSEKSCSWAPWPANEICGWVTKTVCTPTNYIETVCKNVDKVTCAPVTVTKKITETVCDVVSLVPGGDKRVRLCHEKSDTGIVDCLLTRTVLRKAAGPRALAEQLKEVRSFLDSDRDAIVTIIFESYVNSSGMLDQEFDESGINKYVFDVEGWFADPKKQWPTIKEMRDSNKRLVVFSDNAEKDGRASTWKYTAENGYNLADGDGCGVRSSASEYKSKPTVHLMTMNHFYEIAIGQPYLPTFQPEATNNAQTLVKRAELCRQETGFLPNFIALDFAERGTGLEAVRRLNSMARP